VRIKADKMLVYSWLASAITKPDGSTSTSTANAARP
jgi:hypothetical protein